MSRGKWKKRKCDCDDAGTCRYCKDRARQAKRLLPGWKPYEAKGRKVEQEAAVRKIDRELRLAEHAAAKEARKEARAKVVAANKARRAVRDAAFKRNVEKFGEAKAKQIACIITKKQKGEFVYTEKDGEAGKYWSPKVYDNDFGFFSNNYR